MASVKLTSWILLRISKTGPTWIPCKVSFQGLVYPLWHPSNSRVGSCYVSRRRVPHGSHARFRSRGWSIPYGIRQTHELDPATYLEDGSHMDPMQGFVPGAGLSPMASVKLTSWILLRISKTGPTW